MNRKIAFIGAGNMNGALITAAAKAVDPSSIVIADPDSEKTAALAAATGCSVAASNEEAATADIVILGVKPQILPLAMAQIAPVLQSNKASGKRQLLVSIAAGQTIATLLSYAGCGEDFPVIRIMPNTPAMVEEGMLLLSPSSGATKQDLEAVMELLQYAGEADVIPESLQDAAGALSGCSPAFVYLFIEAMADGAVRAGVPREQAIRYGAAAVKGAAAMVLSSGIHPGKLKDQVCSPGGSTIVGVQTLEDGGFRGTVMNAVFDSYEKNRALGQK